MRGYSTNTFLSLTRELSTYVNFLHKSLGKNKIGTGGTYYSTQKEVTIILWRNIKLNEFFFFREEVNYITFLDWSGAIWDRILPNYSKVLSYFPYGICDINLSVSELVMLNWASWRFWIEQSASASSISFQQSIRKSRLVTH